MNEAPRARVFVGAALPLVAFPIAVAAYAVFVSDDHRLDRTITVVWHDNAFALSLIAGVGFVACVASAVLAFIGAQRATVASLGLAPLAGVVVITGAIMGVRSTRVHLGGFPMISSIDLAQFTLAVTKEGLVVLGAGLSLATALLFAAAGAQFAAGWKAARFAGLVSLVGAVGGALASARLLLLNDALKRGLHSGASGLFVDIIAVETTGLRLSFTPVVTLVVLAFVVFGVIALRSEPRHAVMLALLGPAAAFPAGSLSLTASSAAAIAKGPLPAEVPATLLALDGAASEGPQLVLGPRGVVVANSGTPLPLATNFDALERYSSLVTPTQGEAWRVGLAPGASMDELLTLLQIARRLDVVEVDLIGLHEVDVSRSANEIRPLLERLRRSYRAVRISITDNADALPLSQTVRLDTLIAAAVGANREGRWLQVRVDP